MRVEKRKVNFGADTPSTSLEYEEVIEELKACVGYDAQLERLLATFGITQKMVRLLSNEEYFLEI